MPQEGQGGNAATETGQEPGKPAAEQTPAATPSESGQEPKGDKPETFDREYVEKLRKEAAGHRTAAQEAQAKLQEHEDAQKSEVEKAKTKAERAEKAKIEAEAKLLRFEVAGEKNVPTKLVPLLTASTKEGLEQQADLILENAKSSEKPPEFDGGAREPAPKTESAEDAHNALVLESLGLQKQS